MELPIHDIAINHWNPGASIPLLLPVLVTCNTSDEDVKKNVSVNVVADRLWVNAEPAHEGVAILCGSGPSLADYLDDIHEWQVAGGTVFAMNGAATYLAENGIFPDVQVIVDPREATAQLVGPGKRHLFASQVHPACFGRAPDADIYHLFVDDIEGLFPPERIEQGGYAFVGGAASVGNTATCLAYTLGFRNLQIYGYDSSYRDDRGHAFYQAMNDAEPSGLIEYGRKVYRVSFTMKIQAEKFQETAGQLKALGCQIEVHGDGLLPAMFNRVGTLSEVEKYKTMWSIGSYREVMPGLESAQEFVDLFNPAWDETVIDFGCGTGMGGVEINRLCGAHVTLVDFVENSRNPEALGLQFVKADLTQPIPAVAGYGYCTDVMEHVPPADVDAVLRNIMDCVPRCFFRIDFNDDMCGLMIGERLHLSVHPHQWWLEAFERLGFSVPWSRDNQGFGLFHVTHRSNA